MLLLVLNRQFTSLSFQSFGRRSALFFGNNSQLTTTVLYRIFTLLLATVRYRFLSYRGELAQAMFMRWNSSIGCCTGRHYLRISLLRTSIGIVPTPFTWPRYSLECTLTFPSRNKAWLKDSSAAVTTGT